MKKTLSLFLCLAILLTCTACGYSEEDLEAARQNGYDDGYREAEREHEEDYHEGYREGYNDYMMEHEDDPDYDDGYEDGYEAGYDEGTHDGYSRGYDEGYDAGYDNGKADAETSLSSRSNPTGSAVASYSPSTSTGSYIGNKNSHVFHRPTCHSLPAEKNRVYFSSREEAVNSGYRPCGNCKP